MRSYIGLFVALQLNFSRNSYFATGIITEENAMMCAILCIMQVIMNVIKSVTEQNVVVIGRASFLLHF